MAGVCALLVLINGCGEGVRTARRAVLRFEAGVAVLDVPLSDRELPVFVTSDRYVVVFGGSTRRGYQPKGDGAVYDLLQQAWTPMAPAPFEAPLLYPSGAWTGSEVVVVGTPCPDPIHDEDGEYVLCERDPVAAAYSPTRNSWRALPRLQLPEPMNGYTILSRPVGFTNGRTVFSYQGRNVRVQLLMIDPASGSTTFAAAPTEPCAVGGRLLAIGPDSDGSFGSPVEPSPETMRVREWRADGGWPDVGPFPRPAPGQVFSDRVTCGPEAAAYLPVQQRPVGVSRDLYWFGPAGSWRAVPDVAPQGLPDGTRVATVSDRFVLELGPRLFTLAPGGAAWIAHASPGGQGWYVAGRFIVSADVGEGVRIRIVDVDALPAA